jgi:hypothetical protein
MPRMLILLLLSSTMGFTQGSFQEGYLITNSKDALRTNSEFTVFGAITGGVNFSQMKVEGDKKYKEGTYQSPSSPIFGLSFNINRPSINDRSSLHVGIHLLSSQYSHTKETINYARGTVRKHQFDIDLVQLRFPIGFRYSWLGRKITPFTEFGFSIIRHMKADGVYSYEEEVAEWEVVRTYSEAIDLADGQFGFWAGGGAIVPIGDRFQSGVQIRYERTNGTTARNLGAEYLKSRINNIQLMVSIGARLTKQ